MLAYRLIFCLIGTIAANATAQVQNASCASVYANAVRNISIETQQSALRSYTFAQHCESNGNVKSSSTSMDLTIPIKAIKIGFSGSRDEAYQEMQSFCKVQTQSSGEDSASLRLSNLVVVDALDSFNKCRALEINAVYLTNTQPDPISFIVNGSYNPATTNLRIDGFVESNLVCRTAKDNSFVALSTITGPFSPGGPFSITCQRTASTTAAGKTIYPRASLNLSTNLGPYTVLLYPEDILGFDLATIAKEREISLVQDNATLQKNLSTVTADRDRNVQALGALESRLNNAQASAYFTVQGQGSPVACPQDGGRVDSYAQSICGSRRLLGLTNLGSTGGGRCGYNRYSFVCLSY
jgi:hypothetical protein